MLIPEVKNVKVYPFTQIWANYILIYFDIPKRMVRILATTGDTRGEGDCNYYPHLR